MEVVCFEFNNWSYPFNQEIKKEFKRVKLHIIPAGRKPLFPWAMSVFLETFFRVTGRFIPLKGWALSQAVTRRTNLLLKKIKGIKGHFDLVIGHNPGALFPTWFASEKFKCKCGFDVEDYHPGETNDNISSDRLERLFKFLLPEMNFLTFASMPILEEVKKVADVDGSVIQNWFPSCQFQQPVPQVGKLKLVWFSQNISFNRGLEFAIPVIEQFADVELHLFGNCNNEFQSKYLVNLNNVFLHSSLPQESLHLQLAEFDCGLAIEPKKD